MSAEWFASLSLFCLVMCCSPGPTNILATSSGLTHGVRRTLPLILGALTGYLILILAAAVGVGALILAEPRAAQALRVLGAGYMLWMAWGLWRSHDTVESEPRPPLRAWHGATLQLVNPKAWMTAVAAVSIYAAPAAEFWPALAMLTVVIEAFSIVALFAWATFGAALRAVLTRPGLTRRINQAMAILAALTGLMILIWK